MIVSIMQPAYLPWLGYFERIAMSDLHIVLDHVNIDGSSKTKFANRNKIRTPEGWSWLTVPLKSKGKHGRLLLNEVEIVNDSSWRQKHLGALKANYSRTEHFVEHRDYFESVYAQEWTRLADLLRETTAHLLAALELTQPVRYSSQMAVKGEKDKLILNLCTEVGASTYISGPVGRDYLDAAAFVDAGINLVFHEFKHPRYTQAFPGFEPLMSIVDLIFNHGSESRRILFDRPEAHLSADV